MVMGDMEMSVDLLIIGGGTAGLAAARRAAALGLDVCLTEPNPLAGKYRFISDALFKLGCRQGAIVTDTGFGEPQLSPAAAAGFYHSLQQQYRIHAQYRRENLQKKGVLLLPGEAQFIDSHTVRLSGAEVSSLRFKHCIIATGALDTLPAELQDQSSRLLTAPTAFQPEDIAKRVLVIGGGPSGIEIACLFKLLGSSVELIDQQEELLPEVDDDLLAILIAQLENRSIFEHRQHRLIAVADGEDAAEATIATPSGEISKEYDRIIVITGRKAATARLQLDAAGVKTGNSGVVVVNERMQTSTPHIYAVGSVTDPHLQEHAGSSQGRIAVDNIAGMNSAFEPAAIPVIIRSLPPLAWCGLTETETKRQQFTCRLQHHCWPPPPTSAENQPPVGLTKLLLDPESDRILGAGIAGFGSIEAIGEAALAIEMGALAEDLTCTLHPENTAASTLQAAASASKPIQ